MITAVDTNVLLDIMTNSAEFGEKSARALRTHLNSGSVVVCGTVCAELASFFSDSQDLLSLLSSIDVDFSPDTPDVAIAAAKAWKGYKKSGGKRDRLMPDFIVGAHALIKCDGLLTRDRGFYRNYFKGLKVYEP